MHEGRSFKIIYHLLTKGQATAPELASRFEVSVRTIYRDIDALSGAGIPIYTEPGRNGGIHLLDGFVLDRAVLSETEKQEILLSLQSLSATRQIDSSEILGKLSALFHTHPEDWLEVDFSRWGSDREGDGSDDQKFQTLRAAIIRRQAIRITYAGPYGTTSERTVHPLRLLYRSKSWYLRAYCTEKKALRLFKLTRILDHALTEEHFSYDAFLDQPEPPPQKYTAVTLRFPEEMAYRVYDEFDSAQVHRQEDGDLIVSAEMPEDAWLIGFLLSFGTQVDILSPAHLKEIVAEQARAIYEKNKP